MIARIFVQTPFTLSVPTSTQFVVYEFETRGYKVRYFPPKQSDQSVKQSDGLEVKVGGVVAIQADIIHIDFIKDNFNRAHSQILDGDPPSAVIQEVLDFYILRLRHVTKAPLIRPIDFSSVRWRLRYLNDDESELQQQGAWQGEG